MRVAYLILAHDHPQRLRKLVDAVQAPWADIFIHVDKKTKLAPFVEACAGADVRFHESRRKINWGGWASMQIQLDMLRAIRSPQYKYYKLLSGNCYPVKSREQIREFLATNEANCQFYWPQPEISPRTSTVDFYHFVDAIPIENFLRRARFRARPLYWLLRHPVQITYWGLFYLLIYTRRLYYIRECIPRRKRPLKVCGGEMWWCLRHEFIEYLLDFCDRRPDVVRYFKYTRPPNEYMIASILRSSGFPIKRTHFHLNFMKTLNEKELERCLENENILFARKFDEHMIALLEDKLRGRS